jgi:two-component system sensor histidine kinase PilS (NtrC family)
VLDTFVQRQTRTLRGNQILIGIRLLLATLALTVLIIHEFQIAQAHAAHPAHTIPVISQPEPPLYYRPPGVVAIIICALTLLYVPIARTSESNPDQAPKLAFVQIFVDIFLISALIWNTGGVDSQFVVLYLISICSAAFVLKWNVSIMAAAAAATLFSLVTLLYSIDLIPETFRMQATLVQLSKYHHLTILDFVRLLLLPICAFFLTGVLAGTLAERLAVARLLHDEILEGIGEGVLVLDKQRNALYYNTEFQRLLKLGPTSPNAPLLQLLGPAVDEMAREALTDSTSRRTDIIHRRSDNSSVPLGIRIVPIIEHNRKDTRGLMVVLDDITAEKKMEEFLKHRQRIETMGQISSTIAHEISNPMASIRGAVQEIGRAVQIPESKKVLIDIVLSESDRLDQIITDFLRFARMRPPKLTDADVGRVLSDVKILIATRPEAQDVAITLSGDEGEPFPSDPEQLRQVFLNLGVNALQAMNGSAKKELRITVKVTPLHGVKEFTADDINNRVNRPGVLVEFTDTGSGMSPQVCEQIFEPFFTTKNAGTGLGLAIVERIIQSHEGLITVESQQGKGTTFRVWLPSDLKIGAATSGMRLATG